MYIPDYTHKLTTLFHCIHTEDFVTIELEEHINKRKRREHDSTDYCHYRARRAAF